MLSYLTLELLRPFRLFVVKAHGNIPPPLQMLQFTQRNLDFSLDSSDGQHSENTATIGAKMEWQPTNHKYYLELKVKLEIQRGEMLLCAETLSFVFQNLVVFSGEDVWGGSIGRIKVGASRSAHFK